MSASDGPETFEILDFAFSFAGSAGLDP